MSATNYLEDSILNLVFRGGTWLSPGEVYMALHTGDPGEASPHANELTDSGYVRKSMGATPSSAFNDPASNGFIQNKNVVTFNAIVDAQVTVTHWCIFDEANGSVGLIYNALQASKVLDVSDVPSFPIDSLTITMT